MKKDEIEELENYIANFGLGNVFDVIHLSEDEILAVVSKKGEALYCRGKGRVYFTFVPDFEKNE